MILPAHLLIHSATIRKPVQSFAPGTKQPVFEYQDVATGVPCRFDPRPTVERRNVLGDVPKPGWTVFLNPTEVDANYLLLKEDDQTLYLVTSRKDFFDLYIELAAELKR